MVIGAEREVNSKEGDKVRQFEVELK